MAKGGSWQRSTLARCIPYAINCFFTGIFCVASGRVGGSLQLINFAFGLKFLVSHSMPNGFFRFADDFVCYAFYVFVVHGSPLYNEMRPRGW
jgi:hypothetical protein